LDAQGNGRVIYATVPVTFSNLTAQNGNITGQGGGAWFGSTAVLSGMTFLSNTASSHGGGASFSGAATLNGGLFQNNQSTTNHGGGLYANTLALTGTRFISNTAAVYGGGTYALTATLNGGIFQNNRSLLASGGGLWVGFTLALTDTLILSNTATQQGGGAFISVAAILNGGVFQNNQSTSSFAGGLVAQSMLVMSGTQFLSNIAVGTGGGAATNGAATLNGGVFQNNQSTGGSGGGLYAGTLALTGTQFLSNTARLLGGGAYAITATLKSGMFQNNHAGLFGGGQYAGRTLALTGTEFISNTAATAGGGVYLYQSPTLSRIVNSVFARNTAGNGDAMYLLDSTGTGGMVEVIHTTVASPTLSSGTAIVVANGTANITNSLIASHTVGISQTSISVVNSDYNLFFGNVNDVAGSVVTGSNSFIGDPAFVDAANDNYRLTVNSLAAERGIDLGIATDFDGNGRPFGPQVDIGAFELQATNEPPIADAGLQQTVVVNDLVTLDGTDSSDPEGQSLTFGWSQISGTPVVLNDDSSTLAQFTAPAIAGTLVFQLVVTDAFGLVSQPAWVTVTVEKEPTTVIPPNYVAITLTTGIALLQPSTEFTSTLGEGSEPVTFVWDFGDGSPIYTGTNASHVYAPGSYTLTLTATNSAGSVTTTIRVFVPWRILLSIMVKDSTLPLWLQGR
jgi:predicted outer membrane repeat protein